MSAFLQQSRILSVGSVGGILSIGSAGSILSFMSTSIILSTFSVSSILSFVRNRAVRNRVCSDLRNNENG
jgi:hypothetical protein